MVKEDLSSNNNVKKHIPMKFEHMKRVAKTFFKNLSYIFSFKTVLLISKIIYRYPIHIWMDSCVRNLIFHYEVSFYLKCWNDAIILTAILSALKRRFFSLDSKYLLCKIDTYFKIWFQSYWFNYVQVFDAIIDSILNVCLSVVFTILTDINAKQVGTCL